MLEVELDERLEGCNAGSLDSYLRALGLIRLATRRAAHARFWWSSDATLCVGPPGRDELIDSLAELATSDSTVLGGGVKSPWRGSKATGAFHDLRNEADESLLAWFDACSVVRYEGDEPKRINNPLLGQGGGFGRSEIEPALDRAAAKLSRLADHPEAARRTLAATLLGQPLDRRDARRLTVSKKVLGAYQSGRASGPGGARRDVDPSAQSAPTSAWELVLALEGLRAIRGTATRRAGGRGGVQASFPLIVRARSIASGARRIDAPRADEGERFEFLAPLWSVPMRPAVTLHLIRAFRLRVNGRPATDTLDALVSHATARGDQIGFDRLARFAFAAPSDPRYQYAVRRGTSTARGSRAGVVITEELLPFLRRAGGWSPREHVPASLRRARQLVDTQAVRAASATSADEPEEIVALLEALVGFETALARSGQVLEPAHLGERWWGLGAGPALGLGTGLAWAATVADEDPKRTELPIGRLALLTQSHRDGRWQLDAERGEPDLVRSSRPARPLAVALLAELRRAEGYSPALGPRAPSLGYVADLLSGSISDGAVVGATHAAARVGKAPNPRRPRAHEPSPASHGIGRAVASLLLAPYGEAASDSGEIPPEQEAAVLARKARLAALALADNPAALARAADRMLAPAGLGRRPPGDRSLANLDPARVALALILPLDADQRQLLALSLSPDHPPEARGEDDE